jgi:colicin import membrane protein
MPQRRQQEMSETGLSIIESTAAAQLFTPGFLDPIVGRIEREAREEAAKLDISTVAGRKAIASLSFKVAKSKTFVDSKRKELVADEKKRLAAIDAEGRVVWNRLEALQEEVRKPLTDWEQADKIRVAALEFKVISMAGLAEIPFGASVADIEAKIAEVNALDMTNMQEFTSRAELAEKTTRDYLSKALAEAQQREAEKAETIRLRAEAAERERKDNEERIAREAREKAQREAEVERQRIEQEKFEAEARAKQAEAARAESERLAEERRVAAEARAKQEAEESAKRHAEELAKAEERRKLEAKIAEEVAENRRLAAIEAERERVAAEARKVAAETEAREKDKKHKSAVLGAAKDALIAAGIPEEHAKAAVLAIQRGQVPAVRIEF